jgi:hypothetical protein
MGHNIIALSGGEPKQQSIFDSTRSRHPSARWRLRVEAQAHLSLRYRDEFRRAIRNKLTVAATEARLLTGQSKTDDFICHSMVRPEVHPIKS